MLKANVNFELISKELDTTIKAVERISGAPDQAKYWPEMRSKIRQMLIDNLQNIHQVPISQKHKHRKITGAARGWTLRRLRGGGPAPILFPRVNWKATGIMEEVLVEQIMTQPLDVKKVGSEIYFSIGINTDRFVRNYPEAVDEELRLRTGGEVGLIYLTPQQQSEILEMLIKKNERLVDRIWGGIKGFFGR